MPTTSSSTAADATKRRQRRNLWLRTLHQWHWISSATCLVGILLFAITGLTLNHATHIETTPNVIHRTTTLPPTLHAALTTPETGNAPLPLQSPRGSAHTLAKHWPDATQNGRPMRSIYHSPAPAPMPGSA